ncbi:uncharacterized protein METZ01_LOCUS261921, partial [marine metagenome]
PRRPSPWWNASVGYSRWTCPEPTCRSWPTTTNVRSQSWCPRTTRRSTTWRSWRPTSTRGRPTTRTAWWPRSKTSSGTS